MIKENLFLGEILVEGERIRYILGVLVEHLGFWIFGVRDQAHNDEVLIYVPISCDLGGLGVVQTPA
jgi:hypothetical protein